MDVLTQIITKKRERLIAAQDATPLADVRRLAHEARATSTPHALHEALQPDAINIIAEFKRRSPSKGLIRPDANPTHIAHSYAAGGAVAISVLTEEDFFAGSLEDLRQVKFVAGLPVLRKDFIFDEYQVYESAAAGANAILLIGAALDDELLAHLRRVAEDELQLDALVEVHTRDEMRRAAACGANLIGVNNRNLRTFEVSLDTSLSLAGDAPSGARLVSESGLHTSTDLQRLRAAGYHGFLVGETLMRADDPEQALRALMTR